MIRPPYMAEDVSFYAFVLKADPAVLQKLVDDRLNIPSGGEVQFEAAGPFVVLAFNSLGKMYSLNPPDCDKGWFAEQECAVWVRVIDRQRQRAFWFHPYIFVNNSYAMALGREVYGFPKAFGWFQIPDLPNEASVMSMETLALPSYSRETQAVRTELVRAERTSENDEPLRIFEDAAEFGAELLGALAPHEGFLGKIDLIYSSLRDLVQRAEPMVFLKQFPSSNMPGTACYQAIVEAQANATQLRGVSLLPGDWRITIADVASHPVVADLGLAGNIVQPVLQLWIGFDMIVGLGSDIWTAPSFAATASRPQKIAILGGGVGAMTTALQLTSAPDWQSRYEITIYQMGWRLGGKGASGRGEHGRIEEHGLHIWMGFYENAFRIMREVYEENKKNRPPGTPLREWNEAFLEHDFVAITDRHGQQKGAEWEVWPFHLPRVPGTPGDGAPQTIWSAVVRLLGWLEETYRDSAFRQRAEQSAPHHVLLARLRDYFGHLLADLETVATIELVVLIETAGRIARTLDPDPRRHASSAQEGIAILLEHFRHLLRERIHAHLHAADVEARRLFVLMDLGVSVVSGLLRGGYLRNPAMLDSLEDDLQDWLKAQGADPLTYSIDESAPLRGLYDLVFAYVDGDADKPSFEAGPALRSLLLILGAYKGSVFWKMQAGMGDVVFAPMYEVLRDRGVKFEFFNRVEGLELSTDGTLVESIRIGVQATLKNPAGAYDPLVSIKGLPCWPADPIYDQLVEGEKLKAGGFNLESFWTSWQNPKTRVLRAGTDFDQAVLAISIGALPYLFEDISKLPEAFQLMLDKVKTVSTQGIQLWVHQPLAELGWTQGDVVLDAYTTPINTWAVMDQLLAREDWPDDEVQGIHYFCGQMEGGIPDRQDRNAPEQALQRVKQAADEFLRNNLQPLWPKASVDRGLRVVSQYLRANIDPSERYVLSVAGSTRYRLRANESGLTNVVLAGDWTNNGFNAGCVEAAAMSGIQAANAIVGRALDEGIDGPLARALQVAVTAAGGG